MAFIIISFICLFLIFYLISLIFETIKIHRNPRPRMKDSCKIRFKDINKTKTQQFGFVEIR